MVSSTVSLSTADGSVDVGWVWSSLDIFNTVHKTDTIFKIAETPFFPVFPTRVSGQSEPWYL